MEQITIDKIHRDLIALKEEIKEIKITIGEDFELRDSVVKEIETSRKRPAREFVSHEDMKKEFD
jgi:hypothetical protein